MKKVIQLTIRNIKEMLRDSLSIVFCLIFPILMLVLMQSIFTNFEYIPDNFKIANYAPGICVFGYTFIAMFVGLQIASDKNTSFIKRMNIAPINKFTYYLSFMLSAFPLAILQTILFFLIALFFGFPFNYKFLLSVVYLMPSSILYISLGIMIGVICNNEKQTGPISSIFITVVGILGGVFMPIASLKGGILRVVNVLPFSHTVMIASNIQSDGASAIYPHIIYILAYTICFVLISFVVEKIKASRN